MRRALYAAGHGGGYAAIARCSPTLRCSARTRRATTRAARSGTTPRASSARGAHLVAVWRGHRRRALAARRGSVGRRAAAAAPARAAAASAGGAPPGDDASHGRRSASINSTRRRKRSCGRGRRRVAGIGIDQCECRGASTAWPRWPPKLPVAGGDDDASTADGAPGDAAAAPPAVNGADAAATDASAAEVDVPWYGRDDDDDDDQEPRVIA